MWPETQKSFAQALLTPDAAIPTAISKSGGQPSTKRFDVYRNNVTVSLCEALAAAFPVTFKLVGEEFFKAMARPFVRQSPPTSPVLIDYGDAFPEFIEGFAPASSLPYLADVARLEWAWSRAYHAADARAIALTELAALPAETLRDIGFVLHPSLQLVKSPWPVVAIWTAHQEGVPNDRLRHLPENGEIAMIVRPDLDVVVRTVDTAAFNFVSSLGAGKSLGEANIFDQSDLSYHLSALFEAGAVVGYFMMGDHDAP